MLCLSGRFDPLTGVRIIGRLEAAVDALFAQAVPASCPSDPIEKQQHLMALALARIVDGEAPGVGRVGRPEFVAVIDTSQSDGAGGPLVDWGIPVEIPARVLADLVGHADVHAVVVRNGVVLHAPGEVNLGRTTRLANRAQRRALRTLYATCAIPGCAVRYDALQAAPRDLVAQRRPHRPRQSAAGMRSPPHPAPHRRLATQPRPRTSAHDPLPRRQRAFDRPTKPPSRLTRRQPVTDL
jgi:hypothetical protein